MAKNIISIIIIGIIIVFLFLSFLKSPLKGETPVEMEQKAEELKEKTITKLELARETYNFVNQKYTSPVREYLRQPGKVFLKDREVIWNLSMEYVHSGIQNEIFKELLILTEEFNESDFVLIQSYCLNSPHNYWILNISNQEIPIDLWVADNNNLSNSAFGCFSEYPCNNDPIVCVGVSPS